MRSAIFEVDYVLLYYRRAKGSYQNEPRVKMLSYTLVVGIACHLWAVSFPWVRVSFRNDYKATSLIFSILPRWTNEMNSVPPLQAGEESRGSRFLIQDTRRC